MEALRILVVEDEADLADMLRDLLSGEGYVVDVARDGQAALHRALTRHYDAMVVDRGLPAIEGVELVSRLRSRGVDAAVLVLTAYGAVADRVDGLDAGADDYLVKPFEVDELLARLRALFRRRTDPEGPLSLPAGRTLDPDARVVDDGGARVQLSARESALLAALAHRPTRVYTREDLLELVFTDADSTGAVDTYVHYLRRKLGRSVVTTVHGLGYRLGS